MFLIMQKKLYEALFYIQEYMNLKHVRYSLALICDINVIVLVFSACCLIFYQFSVLITVKVNAVYLYYDQIFSLLHLRELAMSGNYLTYVPADIQHLVMLDVLGLNNNHLQSLPYELCCLQHLRHLGLENNLLTSLPNDIAKLYQLQELYCGSNMLTSLPDGICWCSHLRLLSMPLNRVEDLPVEFANLRKITRLILSDNSFNYIPLAVCMLSDLEVSFYYMCLLSMSIPCYKS